MLPCRNKYLNDSEYLRKMEFHSMKHHQSYSNFCLIIINAGKLLGNANFLLIEIWNKTIEKSEMKNFPF